MASEVSRRSQGVFEVGARAGLHLALIRLSRAEAAPHLPALVWDADTVTCLRACLMKREHFAWLDRIWEQLGAVVDEVVGGD